jgi:hypothetical protein
MALALALTACGGGGPGERSDEFVALVPPEGWAVSDSGLKAAEDESDLRTEDPGGPVISVDIGEALNSDYAGMVDEAFVDLEAVEYGVLEDVTVDGFEASGIAIRTDDRVVQYLAVQPEGTEGAVIVLDAPADRYEELRPVADEAVEISL